MSQEMDLARVAEKSTYIREQVAALRHLIGTKSREEILRDPWLIRGVKYCLQTAIEAVIDLAYHVCAKGLGYAAVDGRDAIRKLGEVGVLTPEEVTTYQAMIGFRNRLVHGYQRVTDERVYEIATAELDDFEVFLARIRSLLEKK